MTLYDSMDLWIDKHWRGIPNLELSILYVLSRVDDLR